MTNLEELLENKTNVEIEKAINSATFWLYVIDCIVVLGIYVLIKKYFDPIWAETWLIFCYAFASKCCVDNLNISLKTKYLKDENNEDGQEERDKKDLEDKTKEDNKPESI